jgi:hypothetical protein
VHGQARRDVVGILERLTPTSRASSSAHPSDSSEWYHSLTEDVKFSAHRKYPTAYPLCFRLIFNLLSLFIFSFFLFSIITLVFFFFFCRDKCALIQVWGCAMI